MVGGKKPACNKRGPLGGGISGTFSENISPRDYNTLPLMFISLQNLSLTSTPSNMKKITINHSLMDILCTLMNMKVVFKKKALHLLHQIVSISTAVHCN